MNKISLAAIIVSLSFFIISSVAEADTITVEISIINETKGRISIGLYNNPADFPEQKKEYKGVFVNVTGDRATYTFSGIPSGDYAIAIYHDRNGNGKLDKNFFGIPKEEYAFSNNAKGLVGAPDFDKAKFTLESKYLARIELK